MEVTCKATGKVHKFSILMNLQDCIDALEKQGWRFVRSKAKDASGSYWLSPEGQN